MKAVKRAFATLTSSAGAIESALSLGKSRARWMLSASSRDLWADFRLAAFSVSESSFWPVSFFLSLFFKRMTSAGSFLCLDITTQERLWLSTPYKPYVDFALFPFWFGA